MKKQDAALNVPPSSRRLAVVQPDIRAWHRVEQRIPFRDVDSWGLVWHGHYFAYVDHARISLLHRFSVRFEDFASNGFVMPIVSLQLDLRAPGRADEPIAIDVAMTRVRGAMVDTHFQITRTSDDTLLAAGSTRQVFTRPDGGLLYHAPDVVAAGFDAITAFALATE
jgi:acyl-CoA thioester hydrolase